MTALEAYLTSLREIRSSGEAVDETSYYGALETFFNEIGKTLKPKVRCVLQLKNRGAGSPDGGLFTEDQLKKRKVEEKSLPQNPARGVIEIKPTSDDAWVTAEGEQVSRYWGKYRLVLVTNYRDFLIVGQDPSGKPVKLEPYRLASSEKEFWNAAAHPQKTAAAHDVTFTEYVRRVMLHAAPLAAPEDLASFLASYARDALARIGTHDLPALASVRKALEEALGLTFEGEKGEHFFRSTLVQTLFYGIFSAWVLWSKQIKPSSKDLFDWRLTAHYLRVPVLRKLFHEVADPGQLQDLNLSEILDWTSAVLNRVDRPVFFSKFQEAHAVQYFYEPFLQAFDPDLRKQLGVWYTPPEIVQYMVARVDTVLREELDLPHGLADKNVYVLDPCCGTGSYLVEVLNHIHKTLKQKGDDALVAADLKEAAKNRVFGFELLPAPFVVSHLQLGLLLQNLGAPLAEKGNERIGVFLTNALTGWEPPKGPKKHLLFPELEEERDAAEHVKRDTPILVILGNPPYNGFAGVAVEEERNLTTAYRTTKKAPRPQGQGLNDLYVRFYRMAEHRIAEMSGYGVICFISNYSWLDGLSFTGMRESYLEKFDHIWIDSLNGDKYKTGKLTPEGKPDPSIFSTEWNREGIQVGTAIGLLSRKLDHKPTDRLEFRNFWGNHKRELLLETLSAPDEREYEVVIPQTNLGLPLVPTSSDSAYPNWPLLTQLLPISFPGVQSKQDQLVIDIDRPRLEKRMKDYFDAEISDDEMARMHPASMDGSNACKPKPTRRFLQKRGIRPEFLVPIEYRPFDKRWIYWEPETHLLGRKSPDFFRQVFDENVFIEARQREAITEFSRGMVVAGLADNFGNGFSSFFPRLVLHQAREPLFTVKTTSGTHAVNLSDDARAYLKNLAPNPVSWDHDSTLFYHVVAAIHSPAFRKENLRVLLKDWPRIPLPDSKQALQASATLGHEIAALLGTESPVKGVVSGDLRPELKLIAVAARVGGGNLKEAELALKAGWGHAGKGGITMPGKGKLLERDYSPVEHKAFLDGARALGLSGKDALEHLGEKTCDVYLNDMAYWSNIPSRVWDYTIGGYQVIKKWLSYREQPLLDRPLTKDEVRYVQEMARRIAAILLLEPALDANYES
ncbi:MAG: type ISP restriction/modification enzyme, partial [Candidatus Acidiferrum sp.]